MHGRSAIVLLALVGALLTPPVADASESPLPIRPQRSDHALFHEAGTGEVNFGYGLAGQSGWSLQTGTLVARYAFSDGVEGRLGWDIFGLLSLPEDEFIRGVGDFYFQGKFLLPLALPEDHGLALLATVRPGVGQAPVTQDGLSLGAEAVYSLPVYLFRIDAQAGMRLTVLDDDPRATLPVGGVLTWRALPVLDVLGELTQTLHLDGNGDALDARLLVGARWTALPSLVFDLATGVGLGAREPTGFLLLGASTVFDARGR